MMGITYEVFKNTINRLKKYKEKTDNPCKKSDYSAEIIWLKYEYPDYWMKLQQENKK